MSLYITLTIVNSLNNKNGKLVSPKAAIQKSQVVNSAPIPASNQPQEIKYDSTTDLKQELENIDPQVLDSDFENL